MLTEVRIENMAVIDRLEVRLGPGFTAVTGETGAGKSLLIQALGLIAGERASAEAIRGGAERAIVEAVLRPADPAVGRRLVDEGYADDPAAELIVRRVLQIDGQHRVYVNGRLATAQFLQDLVGPELEIHAQHAQQRLFDPEFPLDLIDRAGQLEGQATAVREAWEEREAARRRLEELAAFAGDRDRELDWLRFQLREFEEIAPESGELDRLQGMLREAEGRAAVVEASAAAREALLDGDGCALDRLFRAEDVLRRASRLAPSLAAPADELRALAEQVQGIGRELSRLGGGDDPERLDELRERVQTLERLARKHGGDFEGALAQWEAMRSQLADLEALDARIADARAAFEASEQRWREAAEALSAGRQSAAAVIAEAVEEGLRSLDMPRARFAVVGWGEGRPGPRGIDRAEFRLAANPGDEPRPVRKVASGGELSRILLAIQGATGPMLPGATVVFDEVDTGIGGETALVVGRRMRALGLDMQVLAVTHTPQVAAAAHQQLHLRKEIAGGRAVTLAETLDGASREAEIARMLGGRSQDTAKEHARSLLQAAAEDGAQ